jgi:hypothetical protein
MFHALGAAIVAVLGQWLRGCATLGALNGPHGPFH